MIPIRILAPVVHYGHIQLVQGHVLSVPEFFADALCADDSAELVSAEEFAFLQAECSQPGVSIPAPKPPVKPKGKKR